MKKFAVNFRVATGSALAHGCKKWEVRKSVRSFTGAVVAAVFESFSAASKFAKRWAGECGYKFCAVRPQSGSFVVSVPVQWAKSNQLEWV
jgi:hypothetical protein